MGCIYICKICKNCKRVLPLIAFHKQNTGKLGRRNICKKCRKELEKDYKKKYRKQHENECKNYNDILDQSVDFFEHCISSDSIGFYNDDWTFIGSYISVVIFNLLEEF